MMPKSIASLAAGIIAGILIVGGDLCLTQVSAASDGDKAALADATAKCKAQVKEQTQFQETSWYARHKMVKKCVDEALAKH